jgi:hypothetical protein
VKIFEDKPESLIQPQMSCNLGRKLARLRVLALLDGVLNFPPAARSVTNRRRIYGGRLDHKQQAFTISPITEGCWLKLSEQFDSIPPLSLKNSVEIGFLEAQESSSDGNISPTASFHGSDLKSALS